MDKHRLLRAPLWLPLALSLVAGAALPESSNAQYFGRNQVQYRTFDFRVLHTENFDLYYYPEEEAAARDAARMAERWYARFARILDHRFSERQPVIMYATHPHFQQTNILSGGVGEGTGGVTEAFKQRVVMPFAYSYEETDHILGHELVHAFQYDISGLGRAGGGIEAAAQRFQVPLWFVEGMAEYLSVGPIDPHTAMWLRDGALRGEIPTIDAMTNDPNVFPYRWGQALWAYVGGRWGDAAIGQILKLTGQGVPYPLAFERILNISLEELSGDWHTAIRRAYLPLLAEQPEAREVARPLITGEREGGRLNLAPVLSPDGRRLVFLSELDNFDVQLYLANAETGEVIRTLQKGTAFDPHFGSLRYISSAGTWSPDGEQFAFSALRQGRDVISILDIERARRVRELVIPGVDEITNPSWSPDGQTIAFSGLVGGLSNLYVVDVASGQSTQLTNDKHAVLHPSFSPDGSRIAFVTDMGPGTDFDRLTYGPYRLALMEVATRRITLVEGVSGQKNINPQWTSDGASLFYISNQSGIPNIYRVEIATGQVFRVTDLFTGVSGITDVSPALTVSRGGNRLLFTEYADNGYHIYSITDDEQLVGEAVAPPSMGEADAAVASAGLLPPVPRPQEAAFNRVGLMLADATTGLPVGQDLAAFEIAPYRARLELDYLGQPQVGVSVGGGAFGSGGLYGGIFGIFSDILARHQVFAALQAQGQLDEIGFAVQYINQRDRWNFGGAAQRVPYVYGYYNERPVEDDVFVQEIVRARFFDSIIQGFGQYPFSNVKRLEFSAGLRRISTNEQAYQYVYRQVGDAFVYEGERQEDLGGISLNLFESSAALIYDNSLSGWTSPFAGQRYRFQVTPTLGELQYIQGLADYRRYFFMNPFTLAVRGLHIGRYGRDSEATVDDRRVFQDLYLGQPWYVRGYYNVWNECQNTQGMGPDCEVLSQLFGSRLGVASAELRFPLIRQLVIGTSFGLPPIEGFIFGDAGVAWTRSTSPTLTRGVAAVDDERGVMTSAGVGARMNLFGFIVVEVDYVKAFARDRDWQWQFNFIPGF